MRHEPLRHLLAPTQLADEVGVEPGLIDPQLRIGQQPVAVEPLDVIALVCRAVAPDGHVVVEHRPHEQRARDRPPERRGVEVHAIAGADVEGTACHRRETLLHEQVLAVDQARELGTVLERATGHAVDIGLVVLPQVGRVGARHRALVAHPGDRHRSVEPPGEGNTDALADGERGEDLGHGASLSAGSLTGPTPVGRRPLPSAAPLPPARAAVRPRGRPGLRRSGRSHHRRVRPVLARTLPAPPRARTADR